MSVPQQGEIWWAESEDSRRPVLIVTRSEAIEVLRAIVVAPLTRTIRGIPTEVRLGADQGLGVECVASFDNLQRISRAALTHKAGDLGLRRHEACVALMALADC
ncbi:MAG: type II toxin-antitoxin system PemK/MazF family toxin [Acidimicrobiales bacterium]